MLAFSTDDEVELALPRVLMQLRGNRLLAYPTETTYGLGSRSERRAVDRLATFKGRAARKPFLLLVDGLAMLDALDLQLTRAALRLSSSFWPGPLTLVLPGSVRQRDPFLSGPEGQVAVRCTSHAGARRIIHALGEPITSTSANRAGLPSAASPAEIVREWGVEIARGDLLVLDGGPLAASLPSTVVDCSGPLPRVVRAGAIGIAALRAVEPDLVGDV